MDTTLKLLPAAGDNVPVISESGIATRDDVKRLVEAGVRGILVGETFMRQENIARAVEKLLGPMAITP